MRSYQTFFIYCNFEFTLFNIYYCSFFLNCGNYITFALVVIAIIE